MSLKYICFSKWRFSVFKCNWVICGSNHTEWQEGEFLLTHMTIFRSSWKAKPGRCYKFRDAPFIHFA